MVAGDGAEIQALSTIFTEAESRRHSTAVGSVKSMIGHTKATAGVAGLIKVALALRNRVLPATLGVTKPNSKANFPASPFYVNSETRPWIHSDSAHPRRAGKKHARSGPETRPGRRPLRTSPHQYLALARGLPHADSIAR